MSEHHSPVAGRVSKPRVVIIGGGFGGIEAAKAFRRSGVHVILIDRRNHHLFQPLLYQVATAALNPANIATPIRRIFKGDDHIEVLLGEVESVDVPSRVVRMAEGEVPFDFLIVATGATHSYFGHGDWEEFAPGLKTLEDATAIRRKVLLAYEAAEREPDPRRKREWTTFVVVGAGPTGVELAGALAEIARHDLTGEFRNFNPARSRVILVEAGPRVLSTYAEDLSESARKQLEGLGVEVRTGLKVTGIDEHGVSTETGRIEARTVLWGAGVQGSPLARTLGVPLDRAGRVLVEPDLSIPGAPEVFVIGDLAAIEQDGKPVPGVAPAAMQGGQYVARMIKATLKGKPRKPFHYLDKGSLATIGRHAAVAQIGKIHLSGFVAWLAWSLIHVFFLIGFRNRVLVMLEWGWLYLFHDRGSRLITGKVEDLLEYESDPNRGRSREITSSVR
ncbi:NAD(P)/FAD-dependent oxidoreductase [Tundrisphaera lichenicola]|uniref:NAD(P)/FAD-dependent oxidoreductase n=1 Tax=Tundrisphaera lichenicola TaxID=2029860 RepID=UPI003EBD2403